MAVHFRSDTDSLNYILHLHYNYHPPPSFQVSPIHNILFGSYQPKLDPQ